MMPDLLQIGATTLVSGGITAGAAIVGIRVHIGYIRERLERHGNDLDALNKDMQRVEQQAARAELRLDHFGEILMNKGIHNVE